MGSGTPINVLLISGRPLILGALQAFFLQEGRRFAVTGAVSSAREAIALSVGHAEGPVVGPLMRTAEERETEPDEDPPVLVVVLDAAGEPLAGAESVSTLWTAYPSWRVLALTDGSAESVLAVLRAGAIGAISHSSDPAELMDATAATACRNLVLGADVQFLMAARAVGREPGPARGFSDDEAHGTPGGPRLSAGGPSGHATGHAVGLGEGSVRHAVSPAGPPGAEAGQPSAPISLTEQESEAVRHLLHGLGNHQIAERMFVSASSVKDYLKSARRKLGARNRAHLAVRAFQLGWTPLASE